MRDEVRLADGTIAARAFPENNIDRTIALASVHE
jgi:hypothetical protein